MRKGRQLAGGGEILQRLLLEGKFFAVIEIIEHFAVQDEVPTADHALADIQLLFEEGNLVAVQLKVTKTTRRTHGCGAAVTAS
jgi:hypothetical protein